MDWEQLSHISSIVSIISFISSVASLILGGFILKKIRRQKQDYNTQRNKLYINLESLRQSIWEDNLQTDIIRDKLQTELYKFHLSYWLLSSPICCYHVCHCIHLLKKEDFSQYSQKIRNDINYILAKLTIKE